MAERIGGVANIAVDGVLHKLTGTWTYDLGNPKRTGKKGPDGELHGYLEEPKVAFIEGAITDSSDLDVNAFQNITSATIQLELANGKSDPAKGQLLRGALAR